MRFWVLCFKGDSASTAAAQKLLEGSESDELPPLEIPETVPLPTEGVKYESLSANQIKQVMDKLTGLVYRRIREYVTFLENQLWNEKKL